MSKFYLGYITVVLFLVLSVGKAYANIEKKFDNFSNTLTIKGTLPFTIAGLGGDESFSKQITDSSEKYTLRLKMKTKKNWWFFSGQGIELKVDDNPTIYKLRPCNIESKMPKTRTSYVLHTWTDVSIPQEIIGLLKNAGKVTIKIYFSEQGEFIWNVPWNVFSEWKYIIEAR